MSKFMFKYSCCGKRIDNGKRYDVSVAEMEDDQLGTIVLSASVCHQCKSDIALKLK